MKAYELISDPNKWIRGRMAEKASGEPCAPLDEDAFRFCAVGALRRVYPDGEFERLVMEAQVLAKQNDYDSLASLNDHWGREAAIEILKEVEDRMS